MNTRSVDDSGVVGDIVFVLRPLPLVPRVSVPVRPVTSRVRLPSVFKGDVGASTKLRPFDGLSKLQQ